METGPALEDDTWNPTGLSGPDAADGTTVATSTIDTVEGLLDEVERALGRLDDGTYGTCPGCGGAVDDERLAESPTVSECSSCASGETGNNALPGAPGESADPTGHPGPFGD